MVSIALARTRIEAANNNMDNATLRSCFANSPIFLISSEPLANFRIKTRIPTAEAANMTNTPPNAPRLATI